MVDVHQPYRHFSSSSLGGQEGSRVLGKSFGIEFDILIEWFYKHLQLIGI